jgi:hypothetical protein
MNKVNVLFASTTVVLAALSMYLGWALHEERRRPDQVENAAPLQARTTEQHPTPEAVEQVRDETAHSRPAKAQAAPGLKDPSQQSTEPAYRQRLTHQTYREAQLAHVRLELERQFPELAAVLNLRPDEVGRLFDLLAQQQLGEAELDKIDPRERQKAAAARRQANRSDLVALLGDAKVAEWEQYVNSQGARAQIRELRLLLADSDYPLRGYQYEPMVAALAAEQQRHNAEREQLRNSQRDRTHPTYEEVIEYMGKRLDLIEASLARRRRAAQLHLDSEQMRRYDSMLELERRRAQIEYDSFVTLNAEAAQARPRAAQ